MLEKLAVNYSQVYIEKVIKQATEKRVKDCNTYLVESERIKISDEVVSKQHKEKAMHLIDELEAMRSMANCFGIDFRIEEYNNSIKIKIGKIRKLT